jgi:HAE1 family hydrophobic/amphiphilic exporter-1
VKIGQSGVGMQLTDGFVNMADAMLVAIGLVYLLLVMLVRLLLVPLAIPFALLLAIIGAFVVLAVAGHARDLSASIGMPMLTGIVVTNTIVLHEIEASTDVRTVRTARLPPAC